VSNALFVSGTSGGGAVLLAKESELKAQGDYVVL
jgi:hypothetical protein